jgi:YVTN family beta-propeller protein
MKTRIPSYANDLGLTLLPPSSRPPSVTFPEPFAAVNCKIAADDLWIVTGTYNSGNPAASACNVRRINPHTFATIAVIPIVGWAHCIETSPGKVWVSCINGDTVYRIDIATNVVDATIIGVTAAGGMAYGNGVLVVSNRTTGTATLIDAATATVTTTVTVGSVPFFPGFDGANFYIPNFSSNTVTKIDTAGNVLATINVGAQPFCYLSDGTLGLVSNYSGTVSVIDEATDAVIATWGSANNAGNHFISLVGNEAWITESNNDVIRVYDRLTGNALRAIATGDDPAALAFNFIDVFSIDYYDAKLRRHNVGG